MPAVPGIYTYQNQKGCNPLLDSKYVNIGFNVLMGLKI